MNPKQKKLLFNDTGGNLRKVLVLWKYFQVRVLWNFLMEIEIQIEVRSNTRLQTLPAFPSPRA